MQPDFDSIDQDHHGVIKYTEFLAACVDENVYLEDKRVVEAFNRLDVDHTGTITRDNLKNCLVKVLQRRLWIA